MIVRKHFSLVKENIESLGRDKEDENLKAEMIQGLKKGFLKSDDEIIRAWIDFYYANKDGALLRRILQILPGYTASKNVDNKPFTELRFLIQYLKC